MRKIIIILAMVQAVYAAGVIAVLEITPSGDAIEITISEFHHLTDELRTRARESLPKSYTVLTRDNIFSLLPKDEAEVECLAEGCAIDVGRAIGADYVTQGTVRKFSGMFTLTVQLYESMSGNMLSSFVTESQDVIGLLRAIRERGPALFAQLSEPKFTELKNLQDEKPELQPTPQIPQPKTFWATKNTVRVLSFVLSAASLGVGVWQNNEIESKNRKSRDMRLQTQQALELYGQNSPEYNAAFEAYNSKPVDVKANENMRNGFYIGAGVFGVVGLVSFWF